MKINETSEIVGGGTPDTINNKYWNGNIQWFTPTEIKSDFVSNSNRTITELGLHKSSAKLLPIGTILLTTRATIGEVAITNKKCTTNQGFQSLIVNNGFNNIFIANWIRQNKNELYKRANGSTFPEISKKEIGKIPISIPTFSEQNKIASFLSKIDERISTQNKIIEDYKLLKKGTMQRFFKQEIRFKDKKRNYYPEWKKNKLGELAKITTGASNRQDSGIDGTYTFFDRSEDIRTSNIYLFDCEAIIVPGEGSDFIPKYFIGKFDLHQRTYAIMDCKSLIDGKFLYYYIYYHRNHFLSQAVGSTVKSLRLPMFQKMIINFPSLEEQRKITATLSSIDRKIELETQLLERLNEQKKYLLQNLFI